MSSKKPISEDSAPIPYAFGNLRDNQIGTNDAAVGLDNSSNQFVGDAGKSLLDNSRGGDDAFTGGLNSTNRFYGDALFNLSDRSTGGSDTFSFISPSASSPFIISES